MYSMLYGEIKSVQSSPYIHSASLAETPLDVENLPVYCHALRQPWNPSFYVNVYIRSSTWKYI